MNNKANIGITLPEVIINNIPEVFFNVQYNPEYLLDMSITPQADDTIVAVIKPFIRIVPTQTNKELFRFQTQMTFTIEDKKDIDLLHVLLYECQLKAIDGYTHLAKNIKTMLPIKEFEPQPFDEFCKKVDVLMIKRGGTRN